jgi:hypothetical protein
MNAWSTPPWLLLALVLFLTHIGPAVADVDCQLLAPPGVTKTAEGDAQAHLAANTILKTIRAGGDVNVSAKTSFATAQQNAPTEDPQALKARTLYVFCGMVANASDLSTERKFQMLKELEQVPVPPSPTASQPAASSPPAPGNADQDIPAKFGLPSLGTSKAKVSQFASTKQGAWSSGNEEGVQFVKFNGVIADRPATIKLWIRVDKLYAVTWDLFGWQKVEMTDSNRGGVHTNGGQDPSQICGPFIDTLVNLFVSTAGVTPNQVTTTQGQADYSPWGRWNFLDGIPDQCRTWAACTAHVQPSYHVAKLENDNQSVLIKGVYYTSNFGERDSKDRSFISQINVDDCTLTVTATRKGT